MPGPTGCLGPATPAGGPFWAVEVGREARGPVVPVAGPPRLTVQLDHGVGPGCGGVQGPAGPGVGPRAPLVWEHTLLTGAGSLVLPGLAAVHLVTHEQHEDEDQDGGHGRTPPAGEPAAARKAHAGPRRAAVPARRWRSGCSPPAVWRPGPVALSSRTRRARTDRRCGLTPGPSTGRSCFRPGSFLEGQAGGVRSMAAQHPPCTLLTSLHSVSQFYPSPPSHFPAIKCPFDSLASVPTFSPVPASPPTLLPSLMSPTASQVWFHLYLVAWFLLHCHPSSIFSKPAAQVSSSLTAQFCSTPCLTSLWSPTTPHQLIS